MVDIRRILSLLTAIVVSLSLCQNVFAIGEISGTVRNTDIKAYIDGRPVEITEVSQGKGNNHIDYYFHLDSNLTKEQIKTFKFTLKP